MRRLRTIIGMLVMMFTAMACVPAKSVNHAALKVENAWKAENDRILLENGRRAYRATKKQGFQAVQLAANRLGMVVESQSFDTGFIYMTAPAPVPLTLTEWERVQQQETAPLRKLIDEDLGLYKWWIELDPSGKDVLVNAFVTETPEGVEVAVGLRLRVKASSTDTLKRVQPPPTALRMGLEKFWAAYEMELGAPAGGAVPAGEIRGTARTASAASAHTAPSGAAGAVNPDAVALIIGNRAYSGKTPAVAFAHEDAEAWKRFAVSALGVREGNIIDLRDASLSEMEAVLGNSRTHQAKLWRWVRPGDSDVFVFFSGHGVPGLKDKRGYLLPVDASPDMVEIQGYSLDLLYGNLAKLEARSVTVFIDACFSGQSPEGMLTANASGIRVVPTLPETASLTVFSAAQPDQVASWDQEARHGLFTRYALSGLEGQADRDRYGRQDGQVTVGEIRAYLDREMSYAARRQYGRSQEAMVFGDPDRVIVSLTPP